jgi:dolichol-phosphate mannosyltransferase
VGAAAGADLVLGSRYVPGGGVENWGALRRMVSRGGSW